MKPQEFTEFEKAKPEKNKHLIVTNNISATNAHGEMSHVWLTTFWCESEKYDCITTFDEGDRQILGLTHWKYA